MAARRAKKTNTKAKKKRIYFNALDKAITALVRDSKTQPKFIRVLAKSELWFFTLQVPKVDGEEISCTDGMPSPFLNLNFPDGTYVPIYSSRERAEEALERINLGDLKVSLGLMNCRLMMNAFYSMKLNAVLNRRCKTGEVEIPAQLMYDIASGEALKRKPRTKKTVTFTANPAKGAYIPEIMLAAQRGLLESYPNYRAAWIFMREETQLTAAGGYYYYVMLHMEPRDTELFDELRASLKAACEPKHEVELAYFDAEKPGQLAGIWKSVTPFYVAADYQAPPAG